MIDNDRYLSTFDKFDDIHQCEFSMRHRIHCDIMILRKISIDRIVRLRGLFIYLFI